MLLSFKLPNPLPSMSYDFLNAYLIKSGDKINPNCRKLIISKKEQTLFQDASKILLGKPFEDLTTIQLAELFWLGLGKGVAGKCLTCNSSTAFSGWKTGYARFCGASCQMKNTQQQDIRKNDALERFGVSSYLQQPKSLLKAKATKNSEEYIKKHKDSICRVWADPVKKNEIVQRMLASRKQLASKQSWSKRFSNKIEALKTANFVITETTEYGKPLKIVHQDCGEEQWFGRFTISGSYICTTCNPNPRIKAETDFLNELSELLHLDIQRNVSIGKYKVDGLIGNIAIDYNGLFWHSAAAQAAGFGQHNPNYHAQRWQAMRLANITLLQIFEDEWLNNKSVVISRVMHAIQKSTIKRAARKCTISTISQVQARNFLLMHHSSKSVPAALALGLFDADELVAVATFGKTRFGKNRQRIELLRFGCVGSIVGGLSKLVKHAIKTLNVNEIISYSDNLWGNGQGYKASGFQLEREVEPGYFYFDKKYFCRRSRQSMRKDQFEKIFGVQWDASLSEAENASKVACYQVFDAGKQLWVFKHDVAIV